MNKVESIRKLNEAELAHGLAGTSASWHETYRNCPFVYVGGLPTAFTEGDLLAIFEQFGAVVHVNLVRDAESGKSKGFAFLEYGDARSAVLAVDNFCGVELGGRVVSVDHAGGYEKRDGRGMDTAPREVRTDGERIREGVAKASVGEEGAEEKREKEVMKRLEMMRRKRDAAHVESGGESGKRKEKRRRKEEKEMRREERARIREERRRRRALRESENK